MEHILVVDATVERVEVNLKTERLPVFLNLQVDGMRRLEGGVHELQSRKGVSRRVPMEPRARIVRDAPGGDFGRQPQEGVLHQVLGLAGITRDAGEIAEECRPARLVGGDDHLIGGLLGFHRSPHLWAGTVPAMGRRSV